MIQYIHFLSYSTILKTLTYDQFNGDELYCKYLWYNSTTIRIMIKVYSEINHIERLRDDFSKFFFQFTNLLHLFHHPSADASGYGFSDSGSGSDSASAWPSAMASGSELPEAAATVISSLSDNSLVCKLKWRFLKFYLKWAIIFP